MREMNVATAAVCRAHGESLVVEAITVAAPGPDEVRVKIEVCAICHSDITYAAGGWGGYLPAIYGHEAAGVVESVGEHVNSAEVGQKCHRRTFVEMRRVLPLPSRRSLAVHRRVHRPNPIRQRDRRTNYSGPQNRSVRFTDSRPPFASGSAPK